VVRPPFPFTDLSFPPLIVKVGSFFSGSFPRTAPPFWQISPPFTLLLFATLFSFSALDFAEEDESEEDELVDDVNILSPEELTVDDDDESGFFFWEEFFLIVAVVPSSAVPPPGCVAAVPVPFEVDATLAAVPPPDPPDSPRW